MSIVIITKDNFEEEIINSKIPCLVDFWAPWCGPCRMVTPIMEELVDDYAQRAKICKINVDEQGELAMKFRVMSIPTIILFKNGEVVEQTVGAKSKEFFAELINKAL